MTKVPAYLLKHGGAGKSQKLADNAFWLEDMSSEYITLLERLDATRDPRLLLPYLKVPAKVRPHLVDLFERLEFKTRKGRRADAKKSYRPSDELIRLKLARDAVRAAKRRGMSHEAAITEAIQAFDLLRRKPKPRQTDLEKTRAVLEKALLNQHTALRRAFPKN